MEKVILVNEKNEIIGEEEKLSAHQNGGKLHRAISVLIYNEDGEMLIQRRALSKYHWPGFWANACCTHPRPNETFLESAVRRLNEEMGIKDCKLKEKLMFQYEAVYDNGLTEKEIDQAYEGTYNGEISINPKEVCEYKWIKPKELEEDVKANPDNYAPWFKLILEKIK